MFSLNLYSGGAGFEYRPALTQVFRYFLQLADSASIRRWLLPSKFFPNYYSPSTRSFEAIYT
jgi:hypothetical protein